VFFFVFVFSFIRILHVLLEYGYRTRVYTLYRKQTPMAQPIERSVGTEGEREGERDVVNGGKG